MANVQQHPVMFPLRLVEPTFRDELTDLIINLNNLRHRQLSGSTHPSLFFQVKELFHYLESIGSARIEGNRTTIAEFIESRLENDEGVEIPANIREILNMSDALEFIDRNVKDHPISRMFVSELHRLVVKTLPTNTTTSEGDRTPGVYRTVPVRISNADHNPPDATQVSALMDELFHFINTGHEPKYDLLKIAIAHHRFAWIHPFSNGNGRTVRLLTYAMLVKHGFSVDIGGRILNPTAVFCTDRDKYYEMLSIADAGSDDGLLRWCRYVLGGLNIEIEKIDKLLDFAFFRDKILVPAIAHVRALSLISETEAKILVKTAHVQAMSASDLQDIFKGKNSAEVSRQIRRLRERKLLIPIAQGRRSYTLGLHQSALLRGIMHALDVNEFLPIRDDGVPVNQRATT